MISNENKIIICKKKIITCDTLRVCCQMNFFALTEAFGSKKSCLKSRLGFFNFESKFTAYNIVLKRVILKSKIDGWGR
jgi:hypothetical protein